MRLTLGSESYDLATRALVVAVVDADAMPLAALCRLADGLIAEGADIVEVTGASVEGVVAAVHALGAAAGAPLTGNMPAAAETGAAFVAASSGDAVMAAEAGIAADRIVLDVSPCLRPRPSDVALGYPILASATSSRPDDDRDHALAAAALAVSAGCRLVRSTDVRGVRRVCDVLAAVIGAGPRP